MKFYVFPTSLTSTGFTIQVYVHLNTILTGSSIGYLVFDKTAALVDTFLLGSSYLVASTSICILIQLTSQLIRPNMNKLSQLLLLCTLICLSQDWLGIQILPSSVWHSF